jgi:hypothetical protein
VLTLGRAAVSERQITLEGGLQAQNFAGRGCRRCCTMCSHRRILCEVVSHTNSASTLSACHGRQAVHQWRAYLASFSLPTVHTTHASHGADTLATSCQHRLVLVCVWPLLLCVYPLCFCHSAAALSAQKEIKLVKCDRKDEIFSGAARQERRPLWASAPSEKRALFSVKKCDLGSW